jgi:hypothetical protein
VSQDKGSTATEPSKKTEAEKAFPLDEGTSDPAVFDNDTVRVEMKVGSRKSK